MRASPHEQSKWTCYLAAALVLFLVISSSAYGRVGYSICTTVSNDKGESNTYCISQTTNILKFGFDSKISGTGNYSKYKSISGFAGLGLKDTSHAKKGRLIGRETIGLTSQLGWIQINEEGITTYSTDPDFEEFPPAIPPSDNDQYTIVVNESLPTVLLNDERINYKGEGISSRSIYVQNDEKIVTNYQAKNFEKSATFFGTFLDSRTYAKVTPVSTTERSFVNKGFVFKTSSSSDQYSGVGYESGKTSMESIYRGSFKLQNTFSSQVTSLAKNFNQSYEKEEIGWLPCCLDHYVPSDFSSSIPELLDHLNASQ